MKKKKEMLLLGRMIKRIAPRIGARVILEPDWEIVGQIIFKNGKRSYFRYNTLDLNPVGSYEIAKDKDYANFFMKKMGYPIVPGSKTFYSDSWGEAIGDPERNIHAAYAYACKLGFPVIVKPNSGSQGRGVSLVQGKRSFYKAMREIFEGDRIALVQQPVQGKDYRIVVLDDKVIAAYERIPLNVVGDGKKTILQLLRLKIKELQKSKRNPKVTDYDLRIVSKLKRQKLSMDSVPVNGERIFLLDNANLSSGGDSVDVTSIIHSKFKDIAIRLTKDMGLRLCGVDLMINGNISEATSKYWVIEVNATPGFDHYSQMGKVQERIIEDLYVRIFEIMERS